ncbi:MAG: ABC transporter substrate-binding protein [Desulfobacterales bacterium]|nr:ABC transporter substrate-binding protein [Desulfobacterales bacterium]
MLKKLFSLIIVTMFLTAGFGVTWAAEPIKVGAPLCLTGPYAGDGLGYWRGIKLAVDEINDAGGLLGRPLEIIKFDVQDFAPERVMQAADKLVRNDKVDTIHAGWAGWGQDVRAYGKYDVPTFTFDASINSVKVFREDPKRYSNWFQLNEIEYGAGLETVKLMADLPYQYNNKKIAVITTDDSWGLEVAAGIKEGAKELGWEVVLEEVVPYGTREWGSILSKIRAINPAWIHLEIVSAPDLITFFRQFVENPTNSLLNFGYGMTLSDFIPNLGAESNGILGENMTIPNPPPTPETAAWIERFNKTFDVEEPNSGSFVIYTGVMMWASAVKAVGSVTDYDAINQYIATQKFHTLDGYDIYFNKDHHINYSVWPVSHIQIQDGKYKTLYLNAGNPYRDHKFITPPWIKK